MKTRFIITALWATGAVCGSLLIADGSARANSDAPGVDIYPGESSGGQSQVGPTATCVTGPPDYDDPEDCTNGDYVTYMTMFDMSANNDYGSAFIDMEVYNGYRSPDDHFYCYERIDCEDGNQYEIQTTDEGCHFLACPAGYAATRGFYNYGVNKFSSD